MDVIIKDVPTQAMADRIKGSAMSIIRDMAKPKVSEEKQTEYETMIDSILVANGLEKQFDVEKEI